MNFKYGTNSLTPYFNANELRQIHLTNAFNGKDIEEIENNYTFYSSSGTSVKNVLANTNINTINYGGLFNIDANLTSQRLTSIMLKRDANQNTKDKAVFIGSVYENDPNNELKYKINLELIYYIDSNTLGYIDVNIKQTVSEGYKYINPVKQEPGVKIYFKTEYTYFYINNTIDKEQEYGFRLISSVTGMSSTNSAVVTTKERVVKETVYGLTGFELTIVYIILKM